MRITIEPTTDQFDRSSEATQHRVVLEHPHDDLGISTVIELVEWALIAYGYPPTLVREYLDPDFENWENGGKSAKMTATDAKADTEPIV